MPRQRVDERAGEFCARGVDDDVGVLVEDEDVLVLVQNVQRHALGQDLLARRWRDGQLDDVAELDPGG